MYFYIFLIFIWLNVAEIFNLVSPFVRWGFWLCKMLFKGLLFNLLFFGPFIYIFIFGMILITTYQAIVDWKNSRKIQKRNFGRTSKIPLIICYAGFFVATVLLYFLYWLVIIFMGVGFMPILMLIFYEALVIGSIFGVFIMFVQIDKFIYQRWMKYVYWFLK